MAKRNTAQFDTLLRIRRRQEDLKARALATARRDIHLAENEQAMIVDAQRRMLDDVREASKDRIDAHKVVQVRHHERHLARLAVEKDAVIGELKAAAEERRGDLEVAMKRRRIVERLVERRVEADEHEYRKNEQKFTDEVAVNKSAMKRGTERR